MKSKMAESSPPEQIPVHAIRSEVGLLMPVVGLRCWREEGLEPPFPRLGRADGL